MTPIPFYKIKVNDSNKKDPDLFSPKIQYRHFGKYCCKSYKSGYKL